WGEGLYDYNKYEGGVETAYAGWGFPVSVSAKYQMFRYPNYSDLLTLYLTGFTKEEPKEDYKNILGSVGLQDLKLFSSMFLFLEYSINYSFYDTKKIIQADGYSGSVKQKVVNHFIQFLPQYKLDKVLFSLSFTYEMNDSNQNYIFGYDAQSIVWLSNYYDYSTVNLKPYITFFFRNDQYMSLVFSYFDKKYSDRPAQDKEGAFLNSDLGIQSFSTGLVYSVRLSKYFTLSPSYLFAHSTSNNKYQKAVSYNYDAHLASLRLDYEY
ncbi:MAG: hypothetical protein PHF84_11420, partial [bacterium]|nr:hypothetical protein [bacterium]